MAQKRFDWVVGDWSDFDPLSNGVAPSHVLQYTVSETGVTHLINANDLASKGDRLRVERVIGQSWFQFWPTGILQVEGPPVEYPLGSTVFITERIYVYDGRDDVVADAAQDTLGSQAFEDADRSFLWQRTRALDVSRMLLGDGPTLINAQALGQGFGAAAADGSLGYSGFDVGVKRVLTGRQLLLYQVQFHPWLPAGEINAFEGTLYVWTQARVGVKY